MILFWKIQWGEQGKPGHGELSYDIPSDAKTIKSADVYVNVYGTSDTDAYATNVTTTIKTDNGNESHSEILCIASEKSSKVFNVNDHVTKSHLDYMIHYNITGKLTGLNGTALKITVDTNNMTGLAGKQFDGRIKLIALVLAYDGDGDDVINYWINDNQIWTDGNATLTFDTTSLTNVLEMSLTNIALDSSDATYKLNGELLTDPEYKSGNYYKYNKWDVTNYFNSTRKTEFVGIGASGSYGVSHKQALAVLTAKEGKTEATVSLETERANSGVTIVYPGTYNQVTVTVNTNKNGKYVVQLLADGEVVNSTEVTLTSGSTKIALIDPTIRPVDEKTAYVKDKYNNVTYTAKLLLNDEILNESSLKAAILYNGYFAKDLSYHGQDYELFYNGNITGDLAYLVSDKGYATGDVNRTDNWNVELSANSTFVKAWVYVPYCYGGADTIDLFDVTFNGVKPTAVSFKRDQANIVSTSGYGLIVYDVTDLIKSGENSLVLNKTHSTGAYPSTLIYLYNTTGSSKLKTVYINNGADIIGSTGNGAKRDIQLDTKLEIDASEVEYAVAYIFGAGATTGRASIIINGEESTNAWDTSVGSAINVYVKDISKTVEDVNNVSIVLKNSMFTTLQQIIVTSINRETPTMKTNVSINEYGIVEINVDLNKDATGTVTFIIKNETEDVIANETLPVENGFASFSEFTLDKGKYAISTIYSGDGNYNSCEKSDTVSSNKTLITPKITNINVTGGEVNVTVDLGVPANGNVSVVYPSGYVDNVTIVDGKVNIYNTFMTEQGNLSFVLDYTGDDNYYGFYEYYVDFFIKYDSDLKVDVKVNEFGQIVIDATVNKTASGNITFIIKNADTNETINLTVAVENGAASFDELTPFEKGNYEIEVDYSGDEIFADAQNAINTVNITKDVAVIEIINYTVDEFGHIVVNANITKGATGNVTFLFSNLDTNKNMTVSIAIGENGTIEYSEIAPLDKGYYNVQIGYDGDDKYYSVAENAQADVNVTKIAPTMDYAVKVTGGEVSITVTLPSNITDKLTVIYPSGHNETVNVTNGSASIYNTFITETGDLAINVSFAGNDQYYAVEKTIPFVIKEATLVKASAVSVVYKNNAKVTVKLTNLVTNKAIASAPIEITVNGKTYKGTTDKDGNAVITIPANMIPKKYTANVVYKGTDRLESDLDEFKLTVKKATPKLTAKKKTFKKSKKVKKYTITLKDNKGKAIKKVKVSIKVGKKTFTAKTNAKGKAVFKLKKLTKKAKYTAKVTFKGNKYFNKITKKPKIIIK